ncbi:phosphate acyltransferase PlsX [Beijerinckia indica]|uniref:Phosphate acyltransferase n=1 Tax=Beijerinckia indica subsp. indica (strain ATCC 9039 / DSM 1715 / NCIMB 8712) TaxID=395963 RepID=PLSX_BEII9|nr:phosphate acyltransferase PlsX [Beijerinckia indica]B2IEJ5.1 RecName: Full=Phosphate acyltransferase; AltName: Full=Acyl-ACP phosphotransacylase; AltName: Full=Acyl-[acyl-carrier-protein]--phosphate acyltransferase; AltName: Full=Phosphate-acyl-ACP acyltransferase [Beijerinckia indica subsp. indica ATCC 9039]ACB96937.1 fatty acid/phospholipid synthesis protein PlsX [Beijerinckia indica subsp. indica ATCC 9039]
MLKPVRIALDAMGGDVGPQAIIPGAARALQRLGDVRFRFYGDRAQVEPLLRQHPALADVSSVHHTDVTVRMDDKPSQALRAGRRVSSMWQAIEAVKTGEADVVLSAGNTGALMAMAKVCLRMLPGIDRPAIAGIWPTLRGRSIVLDIGATIGADAPHLVDLAIMGAAMARIVLKVERPRIGLLNVGVEEIKGLEEVKTASRLLRQLTLPSLVYHGFVEGDDIGRGTVDVVVTEGFTGNIALKTAEGTAKQIAQYIREEMGRSFWSKIGYLLARRAFDALKQKLDPRQINGGVFLGLDGIVIKSHGGSDTIGTANAIEISYAMARYEILSKIRESLDLTREARAALLVEGTGSLERMAAPHRARQDELGENKVVGADQSMTAKATGT